MERSQLCHALTACRFSQPQVRHEDGVGVNKDPLQQLSNVKMCVVCQAQGTVKRQYGFRVMDEQCENCNGEGSVHHHAAAEHSR